MWLWFRGGGSTGKGGQPGEAACNFLFLEVEASSNTSLKESEHVQIILEKSMHFTTFAETETEVLKNHMNSSLQLSALPILAVQVLELLPQTFLY